MDIKINSIISRISFLILFIFLLQGCASSNVSRGAASQFNSTVSQGSSLNSDSLSLSESYQGTNQTTKGVLFGGAAGALAGGVTSGGAGIIPGMAGGAIFGGALGAYIDENVTLADQIINRGNQVIVLGDQVLIVLPSRNLFNDQSAVLRPYAYQTLNLVSQLISSYPNMSVKVAAYTTPIGPERINRALSAEQANAVVKYLWRTRMNTRLLYAEGYGGSNPVEKPDMSDWAGGDNYRVEITLEKLPV
ncbi:MAG: IcmN protein, OmpA family [uncultured bacterium]|nr:MAG: IcmN protein, OmpA family [uncultured bacterium]